jgi:hypothetical protein
MTDEKEDILFNTFPNLFPDGRDADIKISLMRFGFPEDGWFDLIKDLCEKITATGIGITVVQVKEKFGTLRFYFDMNEGTTKEQYQIVNDLVSEAEVKSEVTCEDCGKPGKLRMGGWIKCLCDEHAGPRPEWKIPTE